MSLLSLLCHFPRIDLQYTCAEESTRIFHALSALKSNGKFIKLCVAKSILLQLSRKKNYQIKNTTERFSGREHIFVRRPPHSAPI